MKYVGYYNGEIGPLEEMKIPMLDRAVYFGDGCYDATTFANNNIFAADDHLDRFYNSCKLLEIPFEMSREELRAELQKCMRLTTVCCTGSVPAELPIVDISFHLLP